MVSVQGGCFPLWLHGSNVTYRVELNIFSGVLQVEIAFFSACSHPYLRCAPLATILLSFTIKSHLLTAIIKALFCSLANPITFVSCSVTPSVASIKRIAISDLSTAFKVLTTLYLLHLE